MTISFVIPGRVPGKGRPRATVIRSNEKRDQARAAAFGEFTLAEPSAWEVLWNAIWGLGWKAACDTGFISEYTPVETRREEARIKSFGMAAMQGRAALDGPIWIDLQIQQMPPISWTQRKRDETKYVTGKPDADNQLKLILDALQGVCWCDDSRIAAFACARFYDLDGPEQVTVRFGVLEAEKMPVPEWAPKTLPLFEGIFT